MSAQKRRPAYVPQRIGKRFRWLKNGIAVDREDGATDVFMDSFPIGGFNGHIHIPRDSNTRPTLKDIPTESPFENDALEE